VRSNRNPAIAPFVDAAGKEWLVCVHRGWEQDDQLWYSKYDGHGWTLDTRFSEDGRHSCYGDPAVALYKGKLYCVHVGNATDDNLYWTTFDGLKWSADQKLPDHHSGSGLDYERGCVGLASDGQELFCVHKGGKGDPYLWWTHFNGATWSTDARIQKLRTGSFLALAYTAGTKTLHCVHDGGDEDRRLYYTFNDDLGG
jgi:hypothetical protein